MGCCNMVFLKNQQSIPSQQQIISQGQKSHPFSQQYSKTLFLHFHGQNGSETITTQQFQTVLLQLGIQAKPFFNLYHKFHSFSRSMKISAQIFDLKRLKLASILLGIGEFKEKFYLLFHIYRQNNFISVEGVQEMLRDIFKLSVQIFPKMSIAMIPKKLYQFYSLKLSQYSSLFIKGVLLKMRKLNKQFWSYQEIFSFFYESPKLICVIDSSEARKMLWLNYSQSNPMQLRLRDSLDKSVDQNALPDQDKGYPDIVVNMFGDQNASQVQNRNIELKEYFMENPPQNSNFLSPTPNKKNRNYFLPLKTKSVLNKRKGIIFSKQLKNKQ